MTELFTDISAFDKHLTKLAIDAAFGINDVPKAIKQIEEYRAACSPAVQEFVDFYVQLKLEEMKNEESNINQR